MDSQLYVSAPELVLFLLCRGAGSAHLSEGGQEPSFPKGVLRDCLAAATFAYALSASVSFSLGFQHHGQSSGRPPGLSEL